MIPRDDEEPVVPTVTPEPASFSALVAQRARMAKLMIPRDDEEPVVQTVTPEPAFDPFSALAAQRLMRAQPVEPTVTAEPAFDPFSALAAQTTQRMAQAQEFQSSKGASKGPSKGKEALTQEQKMLHNYKSTLCTHFT